MKLSTTAEALLAAMLQSVKLDKRSTIPILSNARLLGNRIITTDLDDHSIVEFDGTCDEETDLLFPFHIMAGILEDQTGPLTMELISKKPDDADGASNLPYVKIKHNGFTFALPTQDVAKFPTSPAAIPPLLTVKGDVLRTMIEKVRFAISNEESRYALNGALFKATSDGLRMVATEGHRLSIVNMPGSGNFKTLIPHKALKWLALNAEDEVAIGKDEQNLSFVTGRKTLISRSMNGDFPKYEAAFPKPENIKIRAKLPSSKVLHAALKRIALCSDERSGAVHFMIGDGGFTMSAKSSETGQSSTTLPCETDGELKIGLNAEYVLDPLERVEDVPVEIALQDGQNAVTITLDGWVNLLMPMRI